MKVVLMVEEEPRRGEAGRLGRTMPVIAAVRLAGEEKNEWVSE